MPDYECNRLVTRDELETGLPYFVSPRIDVEIGGRCQASILGVKRMNESSNIRSKIGKENERTLVFMFEL